MCDEIEKLIQAEGAYLLYIALYSPDLLPIEYGFNCYKKCWKTYSKYCSPDKWYCLTLTAFTSVNRDIVIKEFMECLLLHIYYCLPTQFLFWTVACSSLFFPSNNASAWVIEFALVSCFKFERKDCFFNLVLDIIPRCLAVDVG